LGDHAAVNEVVSEDFRDLVSGARGKPGMGRIVPDLWASYPDLSVSVEGQGTEGDLVRTRLSISGTDRGRGVMWYPPTGKRVSFGAEVVDRFSGGLLVEHTGRRTLRSSYGSWGTTERDVRLASRTSENPLSTHSGEWGVLWHCASAPARRSLAGPLGPSRG
jgi:predicted ester cyclase